MHRRTVLKYASLLFFSGLLPRKLFAAGESVAPAEFFASLKGKARARAAAAYKPPRNMLTPPLAEMSWDRYQKIRFRPERSLWAGEERGFQARFFPPGRGYKEPVEIYELADGEARRVAFDPAMFDFRAAGFDALPKGLDFAGFRILFHTDWQRDVAAFLGASYFRAVGGEKQYGISARGLAVDTGLERPEEFPVFEAFWLARPEKSARRLTAYALLDSPSVAGAYRFEIAPGATLTIDVDAALYPRKPIERLGVAPLSSMFLSGENDRRVAGDWRPEIHDSDGLALWTGRGERIWRPLVNPHGARVNSFFDENPRGFGLVQRDRAFDHYQDDGAYYDRRPSVWIEPKNNSGRGWGKGAVQLLAFPTADETTDNIAVFWNPAAPPRPGDEMLFSYRMHWGARAPFESDTGRVVATRDGIGGVVGRKREYFSWRFAVDFTGGGLAQLGAKSGVAAAISASRGAVEIVSAQPQEEIKGWRAKFDIRPADDSAEPIDLRLYLRLGKQALTETWIYQWTPPPPAERRRWIADGESRASGR
ncbi:MAG TPA: glucan biosynthesis protein D [Candidatus Binatia bacterium]